MKSIEYNFFDDYETLKCNNKEFEILKNYIHQDGWSWFDREFEKDETIITSLLEDTPKDLAAISVRYRDSRYGDSKTLIPYFNDEIEYLEWDKEAKDLIREIRNKKLNQLGI